MTGTTMSRILVIDDEPSICWGFREFFGDCAHQVTTVASAEEALEQLDQQRPDVVILDVRLPGMDGLSAIPLLRQRLGDVPIIVITAFGDLDTAVRAMQQGAFEYLTKPFDLDQAAEVVRRALQRPSESTPRMAVSALPDRFRLIGSSPAMQQVFKQIALAATSDIPVLITGESGTGKELVARAIHQHSARSTRPFVPVCLPALSPTIVESELFGHVKGAFTGAETDRTGLLELAGGGTVFLDEIGDVDLQVQMKLLRAIEHREILPVGGGQVRQVDFRIIAATNRSLSRQVASGRFREDLYFRLSAFTIAVPPLRERPDDIPELVQWFLAQIRSEHASRQITPEALQALRSRRWPGNVRQLRNAVEYAALLARGDCIRPEHLPPPADLESRGPLPEQQLTQQLSQWTADRLADLAGSGKTDGNLYEALLCTVEPVVLKAVLDYCGGNLVRAARLLGIHRATLRQKATKYNLR